MSDVVKRIDTEIQRAEAHRDAVCAAIEAARAVHETVEAALAAARADALREALEAVKGIDTADIYSTGERHAAEEIRDFAVFLIGKLIEQPTTTGET